MGAPENVRPDDGATKTIECGKHGPYVRTYVACTETAGGWTGSCKACEQEHESERITREVSRLRDEAYAFAHIPGRYFEKRLNDYVPSTPLQKKALAACFEIVAGDVPGGALIGPPGVGKTHLAIGTLHEIIEVSLSRVRYTTAADFLASIAGNWAWNGAKDEAQAYVNVPVLVLDEVWHPGAERDRESIVALIDARYREQLPTIICSNLTWPQLQESLGERPCDRLLEDGGKVIPLDGKSYRLRGRQSST